MLLHFKKNVFSCTSRKIMKHNTVLQRYKRKWIYEDGAEMAMLQS